MASSPSLTMTSTELPPPSSELQAQLINSLKYAVCDQTGKHQVREKNKIYRRQRKRKRALQDESPSYAPQEREGLKRLRFCSEIMPVQSPHNGSWSLETRDTIQTETGKSGNAQSSHQQSPRYILPEHLRSRLPPGSHPTQPTSILRPARSSHTEELDDNSSDWSDCTSDSDSGCYSGSSAPPSPPSPTSNTINPSLLRPRKTVRFDAANLRANHAIFRALGFSDVLYATLGRRRRREVVRKALAHVLQAFAENWEREQERREEVRALNEWLATQLRESEERLRELEERQREREKEKEDDRDGEEKDRGNDNA